MVSDIQCSVITYPLTRRVIDLHQVIFSGHFYELVTIGPVISCLVMKPVKETGYTAADTIAQKYSTHICSMKVIP